MQAHRGPASTQASTENCSACISNNMPHADKNDGLLAPTLVRAATEADLEAMRSIYATYVKTSAATFEYEVPTEAAFAERFAPLWGIYPVFVATTLAGFVVGYAYAHPFYGYAAYDWGCELTIYIDQTLRRSGVGTQLYDALEEALRAMGILSLYACITTCDRPDDPFVSQASVAFHESRGWRLQGRFNECGYKFSRWYDVVWMEKVLAARQEGAAPARKNFCEI